MKKLIPVLMFSLMFSVVSLSYAQTPAAPSDTEISTLMSQAAMEGSMGQAEFKDGITTILKTFDGCKSSVDAIKAVLRWGQADEATPEEVPSLLPTLDHYLKLMKQCESVYQLSMVMKNKVMMFTYNPGKE